MGARRYWEAFGAARKAIAHVCDCRVRVADEVRKYIESLGGKGYGLGEGVFGVTFCGHFDSPPDPKVWKAVGSESPGMYTPRRSTKAGREIYESLREFNRRFPSGPEVGKIIGMPMFGDGMRVDVPGFMVVGDRVLLATRDNYSPPAKLSRQVKRITDLEYERLTKSM